MAALGIAVEDLPSADDLEREWMCEEGCDFPFGELVAAQLGVPLDSIDEEPSIGAGADNIRVTIDGVEQEYSFADFGLDPLWEMPRPLVVVSTDGESWNSSTPILNSASLT